MPSIKNIENQADSLMGLTHLSVGKTQARKEFFPIVDSLNASASAVEITDHDKPVAVLLSYQHYIALVSKLCMHAKATPHACSPNLVGSIQIKADNLETASDNIAEQFSESLRNTASDL
jgi:prevent-host-death family protein